MDDHLRPGAPTPELLERARRRMRDDLGLEGDRWELGARIDRPGSTLFPMHLMDGPRAVGSAYYKVYTPAGSPKAPVARARLTEVRQLLARVGPLTEDFNQRMRDRPIEMPTVLAVDGDRHTLIVSALEGGGIARLLRWAPWRREDARRVFRLLGEGIAAMEACHVDPAIEPAPRTEPDIPGTVTGLKELLSDDDRERLRRRLGALHEQARHFELVYCHGDFSTDNAFVTPSGVGIIDPEWYRRWPGYDIVKLEVRLDYELLSRQRSARALIDAVLGGYGDASVVDGPAWAFRRLWEVIRIARRPQGSSAVARIRRAHAIRELVTAAGQSDLR